MAKQKHNPRRIKLAQPRMQIWLVSCFVGLAGLGLLLQFLVLGARLTSHTSSLAGISGEVVDAVPRALLETLAFSMIVLLPIIFLVGITITLRIAGPLRRFESFLGGVARGEQIGPCKIREGDRLQGLCDLINDATEPVRRASGKLRESESEMELEREPARVAE